jgi:hypothetical protein
LAIKFEEVGEEPLLTCKPFFCTTCASLYKKLLIGRNSFFTCILRVLYVYFTGLLIYYVQLYRRFVLSLLVHQYIIMKYFFLTTCLLFLIAPIQAEFRSLICGIDRNEVQQARRLFDIAAECKGNTACLAKLGQSYGFEVPNQGVKSARDLVKQFYIKIVGETPANASELARWQQWAFDSVSKNSGYLDYLSSAFSMLGPGLEFYCADNYVEGVCGAGGHFYGGTLGLGTGALWGSIGGPPGQLLGGMVGAVFGAASGAWMAKVLCKFVFSVFESFV